MNEFMEQFLIESRELVEAATRELLALENAPDDRELLDGAFRALHTLKGCAGIIEFTAMTHVVHVAEEAFAAVRQGETSVTPTLVGDSLGVLDLVTKWLNAIASTAELPVVEDDEIEATLSRFKPRASAGRALQAPEERPAIPGGSGIPWTAHRILDEQLLLIADKTESGRTGRVAAASRVAANVLRSLDRLSEAEEIESAAASVLAGASESALLDLIGRLLGLHKPALAPARAEAAERFLRVDVARVNSLVALTAELIASKNSFAQIAKAAAQTGNPLAAALKEERLRLDRLVGRLQETTLNMRVVPLRTVFQRFQRVIRELAISLAKSVSLTIEGDETEVDKAVAAILFEPLLHIIRNAMDHGVETPSQRAALGKPAIATIALRARRQGQDVLVEVEDDGRGLDRERIRTVAVERGVADPTAIAQAGDDEVLQLIFLPGFSTAGAVSELSGRGVGMDAVRAVVERVGGRVSVESERGRGALFRLTLPFSMMVTSVMTLESCGQLFGAPLDAVVATLRVPRERIHAIGSIEAFAYRDQTVPLVDLAQVLGRSRDRVKGPDALVLVASVSGQLGAVEVDSVGERMDVILRPVEGLLSGAAGIAGTTLTGDGEVLVVLDLPDLLA